MSGETLDLARIRQALANWWRALRDRLADTLLGL